MSMMTAYRHTPGSGGLIWALLLSLDRLAKVISGRVRCPDRAAAGWGSSPYLRLGNFLLAVALTAGPLLGRAATTPAAIAPSPADQAAQVPAQAELAWSLEEVNLVENGGFETGNINGWSTEQIGLGVTQMESGTVAEGAYSTLITAVNVPTGQFGIYQNFSLPAEATQIVLRWSDFVYNLTPTYSNEPNNLQGFRVELRNPNNTLRQVLYSTQPGDPQMRMWAKQSADLSEYRGQTVRIAFVVYSTLEQMIALVDRVSLFVGAPAGIASEVSLDTSEALGPEDLIGITTNRSLALPALQPDTTYYWRVLTRWNNIATAGPLWRFSTGPRGTLDRFQWDPIPSPQQPDTPFPVRLTAVGPYNFAITNFSKPVQLSAWSVQFGPDSFSLLQEDFYTAYTSYKNGTVGYAFTPESNLWVRAFRAFSGDQISLWTDQGVLLARQDIPPTDRAWIEIPLAHPLSLQANRRYRIGVYCRSLQSLYTRFDGPGHFAHGTIDQGYEGAGSTFPTNPHPARWWFVDLVYHLATLEPLSLSPTAATNFVSGTWTGMLTLTEPAANVTLQARSGPDVVGYTDIFTLTTETDADRDGMPDDWETLNGLNPQDPSDADEDADGDGLSNLQEYWAGTDPNQASSRLQVSSVHVDGSDLVLVITSVSGKRYQIERASDPAETNWSALTPILVGTGGDLAFTDPGAAQAGRAFYRVRLLP